MECPPAPPPIGPPPIGPPPMPGRRKTCMSPLAWAVQTRLWCSNTMMPLGGKGRRGGGVKGMRGGGGVRKESAVMS